jgi:hypothetical protein
MTDSPRACKQALEIKGINDYQIEALKGYIKYDDELLENLKESYNKSVGIRDHYLRQPYLNEKAQKQVNEWNAYINGYDEKMKQRDANKAKLEELVAYKKVLDVVKEMECKSVQEGFDDSNQKTCTNYKFYFYIALLILFILVFVYYLKTINYNLKYK